MALPAGAAPVSCRPCRYIMLEKTGECCTMSEFFMGVCMRIYLARHGMAVPGHIDPASPLSDEGKEQVEAIGKFLAQSGVSFTRVFHSGKTRARQTAEILARATGSEASPEHMPGLSPMDPVEPVLLEMNTWTQPALVTGHLPFMGNMLDLMLAGRAAGALAEFFTGSMACLEKQPAGGWTLRWMISPELFTGLGEG